jgi:predicted lipid-binding transport protein (Tim44 family)
MKRRIWVFLSVVGMTVPTPATFAQNPIVYPARGQNQAQQDRDRYECHSWAVQQSGYDPTRATTAAAPPPPPPPAASTGADGSLLRGAARGAVVGTVGGAIAGDAGKGAAIGAASGALIGGIRRRDRMHEQQQQQNAYYQQQQQQAAAQAQAVNAQHDTYNRALTACLQGRGYTVN